MPVRTGGGSGSAGFTVVPELEAAFRAGGRGQDTDASPASLGEGQGAQSLP